MPAPFPRRAARLIALLTGAVIASIALPIAAAEPSTPSRVSFGVQPASNGAPDARGALSYSATPGAVINDEVAVENIGAQTLPLTVYASDAVAGPDGTLGYPPTGTRPVDAGAWISVRGPGSLTIPGRPVNARVPRIVIVPIRVVIPASATPGDHVAAVIVSLISRGRKNASGAVVNLDQRVAERIYIRISGQLQAGLRVSGVSVHFRHAFAPGLAGTAVVRYTVRNVGNALLAASQRVTLHGLFGQSLSVDAPRLAAVLPGDTVVQSVTLHGVQSQLWLTADVTVSPNVAVAGQVDPPLVPTRGSGGVDAVPWFWVSVLVLVLVLVSWNRWRRLRRATAAAAPAPASLARSSR